MDELAEITRMIDQMARVASLEMAPPRLNVASVMAHIQEEGPLYEEYEETATIPWELVTATGTVAAAAIIIVVVAWGAWHELHNPYIDLKHYLEFIV